MTFEKLKANFRDEPRVHPIHAGLYSRGGSLRFRDDASRGAIFAADGEIEMPVTTIDEVLGDKRLTYIKMNIEGAEIDALQGGRKSISKWHPRLALSIYHRARRSLAHSRNWCWSSIRTISFICASTMAASSRRCYMRSTEK